MPVDFQALFILDLNIQKAIYSPKKDTFCVGVNCCVDVQMQSNLLINRGLSLAG